MFEIYICPNGYQVIVADSDLEFGAAFYFECGEFHVMDLLTPTGNTITNEKALGLWEEQAAQNGYIEKQ